MLPPLATQRGTRLASQTCLEDLPPGPSQSCPLEKPCRLACRISHGLKFPPWLLISITSQSSGSFPTKTIKQPRLNLCEGGPVTDDQECLGSSPLLAAASETEEKTDRCVGPQFLGTQANFRRETLRYCWLLTSEFLETYWKESPQGDPLCTMAFEASMEELHTEASCPICLGYLTDAVTTECGHNFCRSCIYQHCKDLQDTIPCPVCSHHCLAKSLKGNPQLCHMAQIVMQLPDTRSKRRPLCKKHSEVLDLFCEEDLELLCPQCRVSSNHQDHCLTPIDQAATCQRRKLKNYIKLLRVQIEDAEMECEIQVSRSVKLRWEMEKRKRELRAEFEELNNFFRKEQFATCFRLIKEEKIVEEKLVENKSQISAHIATLKSLLSEIREKYMQADLDLLRGIRSIHSRYTNIKPPAVFSYELKTESCHSPLHYFGLQKMLSTFQVDLTLNSQTSHPNLVISADGKSVKYKMMNSNHLFPQPSTFFATVQSYETFESGRHFWQVEVRGTGEWSLGVCSKSFFRKDLTSVRPSNGCWQIRQSTNITHVAQVRWVGVFLDYELGEVSFYNLNSRSHMCTFTEDFRETLVPFFSIECSSESLTITIVREE